MKQVRNQEGQVFGPYTSVTVLEDRYDCLSESGSVHLPFSVVGNECVIEDYVPPPEPEPAPETPNNEVEWPTQPE